MRSPDKRLLNVLAPWKVNYARGDVTCLGGLIGHPEGIGLHLRTLAPVGLFVAGVACIAGSVLSGETEVSLLLVFPVFSGSSALFLLGTSLIVLSFIAGFLALMMGQAELASAGLGSRSGASVEGAAGMEKKYGGVVLLGPVPIAFGSDKKIALAMLAVGVVLALVLLVLLLA